MAVGRDHEARRDRALVGEGHGHAVAVVLDGGHAGAFAHVDAEAARVLDQCGVELEAGDHPRVRAVGRERHLHRAPGGRHEHGVGDPDPRGQRADVVAEVGESTEGTGGEAVAARLVAGEGGLVDDERVEPAALRFDAGGDPGGTGPDDHQVQHGSLQHGVVQGVDGTHVSHRRPDRGKNQVISEARPLIGAPPYRHNEQARSTE